MQCWVLLYRWPPPIALDLPFKQDIDGIAKALDVERPREDIAY